MKIYLVRHGETRWNVEQKIQGITDIELNLNGKKQAIAFYDEFSKLHKIDAIYTSPLKRAIETAQIYSEQDQIPLFIEKGLEEMNLGLFEGISWDEVRNKYKKEYEVWRTNLNVNKIPNGESYHDVAKRCHEVILKIKKECNDKDQIMVVSHSATIKAYMCYINQTSYYEMNHYYSIKNLGYHEIEI